MVMNPEVFNRIEGDFSVFEQQPLNSLVEDGELVSYIHKGYWQCMDTLREKQKLEELWSLGKAPWKIWED
jgi:glucose-1-phosphate cytidylyltransferase